MRRTTQISPVLGQLLRTSLPAGFVPVFEKTSGTRYTRELVPVGETVDRWTQMITVTGEKGLAARIGATPRAIVEHLAADFRRACPASFTGLAFPDRTIDGREAFVAVASCGSSPTSGGTTSESALIVGLRGDSDFYTVQWAVQGERSDAPVPIDPATWTTRFRALAPIKLCPIVPGEPLPYPSCLDSK